MGGDVVELVACFPCRVFWWGGLLRGKGTDGRQHCNIDGVGVIQEDADDLLHKVLICLAEREGILFVLRILHLLPIVWLDVGVVRLMLYLTVPEIGRASCTVKY